MAQRSFWIDNVKAICMIGVYLLHSEAYYGFGDIQIMKERNDTLFSLTD